MHGMTRNCGANKRIHIRGIFGKQFLFLDEAREKTKYYFTSTLIRS